ncbi:MAG: class II glutamine amidotransferase, partial [Sorangium cellulosum]
RVLDVDPEALVTQTQDERLGWGLGFYQGGEALLRRRPMDDRDAVDVASLIHDVRTDALIGNVRTISFGEPRTHNTEPFRYRQWLFAHHGTIERFDRLRTRLAESIPDFLRRNVRGETDGEFAFYLFLSFLHDAGRLNGVAPATGITEALRGTLALIDRLAREEGVDNAGEIGILVSDGEMLVGLSRGANMAYRPVQGENDIETLLSEDSMRRRRLPDMARVRFCVVASGLQEKRHGWTRMPDRSTLVLDRFNQPVVETF